MNHPEEAKEVERMYIPYAQLNITKRKLGSGAFGAAYFALYKTGPKNQMEVVVKICIPQQPELPASNVSEASGGYKGNTALYNQSQAS